MYSQTVGVQVRELGELVALSQIGDKGRGRDEVVVMMRGLDERLFHSSRYNPHHVLYRLLPRPKDTGHSLRQRAHNLTLPSDVGSTARQNFLS